MATYEYDPVPADEITAEWDLPGSDDEEPATPMKNTVLEVAPETQLLHQNQTVKYLLAERTRLLTAIKETQTQLMVLENSLKIETQARKRIERSMGRKQAREKTLRVLGRVGTGFRKPAKGIPSLPTIAEVSPPPVEVA